MHFHAAGRLDSRAFTETELELNRRSKLRTILLHGGDVSPLSPLPLFTFKINSTSHPSFFQVTAVSLTNLTF